ncbi:adaptor protein MecA [Bombilactobacillus bombi]|uniref:Adaptor protein MecA n=1 Tax=Bombilactobacillus bombi TaxID=1303590 RepID=A0A347SS50_9LACO|nr:adaptor protein MecA [Bombilactobacillus bombi]AXX64859.1 adaptor protein MecA [Bombilactobacillus bombi]RHW47412.1 adaptor protein MecA [Bombilactobacillus bombi]
MEIEHVSENMIRVVLGNHDLKERGVTVLDLLGNRKQIESFFYSILEEVDTDHTFAQDQTVTFQVVPNSNGLELLISKAPKDGKDDSLQESNQFLKTLGLLDQNEANDDDMTDVDESNAVVQEIVVKFDNFEDFVALSQVLVAESVVSDLYKYQNQYYLKLTVYVDELRSTTVSNLVALLQEYGQVVQQPADVLSEFGQVVMQQTALELTRYYFK